MRDTLRPEAFRAAPRAPAPVKERRVLCIRIEIPEFPASLARFMLLAALLGAVQRARGICFFVSSLSPSFAVSLALSCLSLSVSSALSLSVYSLLSILQVLGSTVKRFITAT